MIREDSYNLTGLYIGIVKDYNLETRKVAVYLPKLMPAISEYSIKTTQATNLTNSGVGEVNYSDNVTTIPYIWVSLMNWDDKMPDKESTVAVYFLDNQISKGVCFKFNVRNEFSVVPSEAPERLFTLNIGNQSVECYKGDTININLPTQFKVTCSQTNGAVTFNIQNNT